MPRSSEERWKEIEQRTEQLQKSRVALQNKREALGAVVRRKREELKKWEESTSEEPVELRMAAQLSAARRKKMLSEMRRRGSGDEPDVFMADLVAQRDDYKKEVYLRERIDQLARHRQLYTMQMLYIKLEKDLPEKWKNMAHMGPLYDLYMAKRNAMNWGQGSSTYTSDQWPEYGHEHWSGHGPVTGARAALRAHGSVVDSVFAKLP